MRYGSVSSGIECAAMAWAPLGWSPAFLAEIDPFASTVLHHHHSSGRPRNMPSPDAPGLSDKERRKRRAAIKAVQALPEQANGVPNHGDMTTYEEWPDADIDLLIGGTPCQSYSIAGLRAGLDDPRGDLTLTYAAIARRFRPRWLVWENVYGVRRLTPLECCRLQGVPDDHFIDVVWRGKSPPPDGPIYKTLGNGFSINVVRWIGRRIEMVEELLASPSIARGGAE